MDLFVIIVMVYEAKYQLFFLWHFFFLILENL